MYQGPEKYYQPDLEKIAQPDLEALQLERLKKTAENCYANIPFYKRIFDEQGITPADITSLDDLRRLPFTTKQDMRDAYP
ncbi:MAG: hypothetical protein LBU48_03650, partial [Coriobacteriales bacterium]|nr:hypothetical protein [Coriobacteriales bacterium]